MKAIRITIIFYMISAAWYPLYSETNLIKNGSFETGKNGQADGWKSVTEINGVARGIIELSDKGFFKEGKFSLHMQSVNTSPGKDRISISCSRYLSASPDTYLPGKPFVLEFYAKSPVLNQTISLSYYTPSRWQPHWRKSKEFTLSDQWQKYAMSVIIPDAAFWQDRVLTFFIYLGYGEIFLDNVSARMEQEYGNTDSTPQDKSLIPGSDEEYHALLGKNLILNSGAERGWYQVFCQPANFGSAYEQFSNTGLVLEPNGYQGGACFSFYGTEKPIDNNNLQLSPIFLKANKKYFLSGYARSDRDNAEMIISFIQQSGTAYIKKVKLATAWRRYDMLIDNCGSKTQSDSQVKCHRDMGSGPETEGAYLAIPKFTGITPGARYFLDNIVGGYGLAVPEFKKEKILIRDRLASDRSQFIPGEKITIPLEFENPGAEMAEILMRYSITDFFGNELAAADIPITAVPAGKTAQYILATAVQKWGVFNLTITVKTSNDLIRHVIRLNTLTRPKKLMPEICIDLQLPFGTMKILDITQYCRKLLRDYVSAFGAGMVRLWLRDSRENENGYDQADREAIIALQEAHALGIKNYYCWSNPRNHWDKEFFDDINNRHLVPADLTEYTNMLTRRYQKYNGLIDYFELLNEPNIWVGKAKKPFPQGYQEINPEYYAALAKTTYKVLKKINPELPIIGPTTAGLDLGFIEDVLRQGTAKYLNGISYHGYPHLKRGNYTGDAENLKTILQRNNGEHLLTNIFQSEAGIQAETITREWEISRLQISMACKIPQMILLGLGEQQKSYNIFRISPLQTMGIEHALLLIGGPQTKNDYLAAPVLFSLRALNERLAGTVFNRKIVINPDIHCLIFNDETASKTICTLWMDDAITGTISMELPESNGLILYDLMGNLRPLSNRTIFLDHVPVYIETKYPPQILE
ncbi:MAG TPA: hypothetical protein DC049_09600 [Spirochaetia bacterium]|nr:hypothetical protein [Spirochaetia bacterium]